MTRELARDIQSEGAVSWTYRVRGGLLRYIRVGGIFVVLVLLSAVMSFASPYFLTPRNLMNILVQGATLSIIAAGQTLVLIEGEIDLSIGSMVGLTGALVGVLLIVVGVPMWMGVLVGLSLGILVGLMNGLIFTRFRIPSFIVTLAVMGIAHGLALTLTWGRPISGFPTSYLWFGQGMIGLIPVPVVIAGIVYLVLQLMLTQTKLGVMFYAVGGGRKASKLAGVPTDRMLITAYVISGLLAAVAGIVLTSRLGAAHGDYGQLDLLDTVAATVIGGTSMTGGVGTVIGTLGGVLIISVIRNGLVLLNVQAFWQMVAVGIIILLAVLIDQFTKRSSQ